MDLLVAGIVAAFGLAGTGLVMILYNPLSYYSGVVLGAVLGLMLHEYAHKTSGLRVGCYSRFVLYPLGLALTLVFGILRSLGFWFALIMPGYVLTKCYYGVGPREAVRIASSGPLTNIVLAVIGVSVLYATSPACCFSFIAGFSEMNAWLAFFNLLPFDPLDGAKIFRYAPLQWLVMIVVAALLFYASW